METFSLDILKTSDSVSKNMSTAVKREKGSLIGSNYSYKEQQPPFQKT